MIEIDGRHLQRQRRSVPGACAWSVLLWVTGLHGRLLKEAGRQVSVMMNE